MDAEPGCAGRAGIRLPAWLPNAITTLRIGMVPVWGILAEAARATFPEPGWTGWRAWSLVVLLAICLSDVVDGWLARRFDLATRMGATLDAVADKLAQVVLLSFFTLRGPPAFAAIAPWFLILVFARDLALLAGYAILRRRRGVVVVVHEAHGRLSSLVLFALLLWINSGGGEGPVRWVLPPLAALVCFSTLVYGRAFARQLRGG
ncbi:MAG: CDP-alcohol phosphatidyltransferase family protein [Planctomycetes bacterium]|nr:CDP-alcohol phosphatidyltransferase family protein [Planctomycetota bacterium]